MSSQATRRTVLQTAMAPVLLSNAPLLRGQERSHIFSLPIGLPGQVLGDGFFIRHGYATENTWYNPGWLHAGEDWYAFEGDTAGAGVYAIADGEIVYSGSDYPGLVVVVRHTDVLYSMYGHLDYSLAIEYDSVERGQQLGTVLARTDGRAPSHLHFEVRAFLTTTEVNGASPRYSVGCGFECPPGPGYWPIDAPEHPSDMGWRNPTHVVAKRAYTGAPPDNAAVIVASGARDIAALWSLPTDRADAEQLSELSLDAGDRYQLLSIATGKEASEATSAEGYRLWYRIIAPDVGPTWVQAALPSGNDAGSDGRPSSIRFDFLPVATAG